MRFSCAGCWSQKVSIRTMKTALTAFLLGLCSLVLTQDDSYRLPPNYIVNHYDIDLVIPAEALSGGSPNYTGYVEITFQVK